jgi:predicted RNA methylase
MARRCSSNPCCAAATGSASRISSRARSCSTTIFPPAFRTILKHLDEQFVLPPLHAGWAVRRKSNHFAAYDEVAGDFARLVGIDPWRINPYFSVCDSVNFHQRQGEECLATNVDAVLE